MCLPFARCWRCAFALAAILRRRTWKRRAVALSVCAVNAHGAEFCQAARKRNDGTRDRVRGPTISLSNSPTRSHRSPYEANEIRREVRDNDPGLLLHPGTTNARHHPCSSSPPHPQARRFKLEVFSSPARGRAERQGFHRARGATWVNTWHHVLSGTAPSMVERTSKAACGTASHERYAAYPTDGFLAGTPAAPRLVS